MIKVIFIHRKRRQHGHFSIEFIFEKIRAQLAGRIRAVVRISKFESSGMWKKAFNTLEAATWRNGDVLHVTGDVHFLTLLLPGRKSLLTIHDCIFMNHPNRWARRFFKLFWLDIPVRKCRMIVATSEATKKDIIRYTGCKEERIRVIPVPISEAYQPFSKPFNKSKPVILQVGLAPNKNLDRLAEALEGISCKVAVVGKLDERQIEKLERHGIDYSSIHNISDEAIVEQFRQCDLLFFASTLEGFGMPILEAQAVGRAVITANISSMPFVAGDGACLVNPFDVQSIRQGILQIISDDDYRNQLIANGFSNRNRFDSQKIANDYYSLYCEIAKVDEGL